MNAPNVRSVTVRLDAAVAKYVADIKMAGRETERAFDKAYLSVRQVNNEFERGAPLVKQYRTEALRTRTAIERTDASAAKLATSMGKLNTTTRLVSPAMQDVDRRTTVMATNLDRSGNIIDRTSGRLRLLLEALAILGPSAVPIGAAGVVGLGGLAGIFTAATVGALGLAAATQGVGDALKAVEKARLAPTIANLQEARDAMRAISPEAREWVRRVQEVLPLLKGLRDAGAAGLFPGLTESINDFERLEPILTRFMTGVGKAGGDTIADITESLASDRWEPFLEFLAREAPEAIENVSTLVGDLAHGAAELWMAFDPGNDGFVDWALDVADAFDRYASSAQGRRDIEAFLDFARENGPQVADTFLAIVDALTQIIQAAAPLGGPSLKILETFANIVAKIADSDLGTPLLGAVAALSVLNRTLAVTDALQKKIGAGALFAGGRSGLLKASAAIAGFGIAASGAADGIGLTNAASFGLMGTLGGPWGAALGTAIGLVLDIGAASEKWEGAQKRAQAALDSGNVDLMNASLEEYEAHLSRLTDLKSASGVQDWFSDMWGLAPWNDGSLSQGISEQVAQAEADLKNLQNSIDGTGIRSILESTGATAALADPYTRLRLGAKLTAAEIRGLTDAMRENRNVALGAFDAVTRYREALKAARIQGRKNNEGIEGNSKAALENRHILAELASAWNDQSAAVRNNVSKFREARRSFIETATAMGVPIDKAKDLARELLAIPRQRVVDIDVKNAQAMSAISAARSALNTLPRNIPINIHVSRTGIDAGTGLQYLSGRGQADGGTVPGPRAPYRDKVLSLLAPGEEVITNRHGEADRFRADRAAGRIPAYADGTTRVITRRGDSEVEREARRTAQGLKNLTGGLKEAEKAVERERRQRDALVERMDQIRSGLAGGLTTDLGGENNPWASQYGGATLGGNLATIRSDTAEAQRTRRLIRILREKGFDGKALEDLLSRGDTNEIADFASSSRRELREYEQAFNQRARYVRVTSNLGADAALGKELRQANGELRDANRELQQIKAELKQANKDRKEEHQKDRDNEQRGRGNERRDGRGTR